MTQKNLDKYNPILWNYYLFDYHDFILTDDDSANIHYFLLKNNSLLKIINSLSLEHLGFENQDGFA